MNARWHALHVMPRAATLEARISWHVAHAWHCGCRAVPPTVADELRRRRLSVPAPAPGVAHRPQQAPMTAAALLAFLRSHRVAVEASAAPEGGAQAAVVGIAVTDRFEIVFDTLGSSRKARNLRANPAVAFVLGGLVPGEERTAQDRGRCRRAVGRGARTAEADRLCGLPGRTEPAQLAGSDLRAGAAAVDPLQRLHAGDAAHRRVLRRSAGPVRILSARRSDCRGAGGRRRLAPARARSRHRRASRKARSHRCRAGGCGTWTAAAAGRRSCSMHAASGSSLMWQRQIPVLRAAGYRCIAYDRVGWGRSELEAGATRAAPLTTCRRSSRCCASIVSTSWARRRGRSSRSTTRCRFRSAAQPHGVQHHRRRAGPRLPRVEPPPASVAAVRGAAGGGARAGPVVPGREPGRYRSAGWRCRSKAATPVRCQRRRRRASRVTWKRLESIRAPVLLITVARTSTRRRRSSVCSRHG